MFHFRSSILSIGVLSLLISFGVQAQETTVIEKRVIVSPSPTATCTSVIGHFEGSVWIATHDVCKYENRAEGVAWVNDYWSCTVYSADGVCTSWALVPGHWIKTLE